MRWRLAVPFTSATTLKETTQCRRESMWLTRQTLYRHVSPKGELRKDGLKITALSAGRDGCLAVQSLCAITYIAGTALLTSKERDVLQGLVRKLSNKEIALSMEISDQTIKWHIKNLFSKLNAVSRKQAVARAQLLGLIVES